MMVITVAVTIPATSQITLINHRYNYISDLGCAGFTRQARQHAATDLRWAIWLTSHAFHTASGVICTHQIELKEPIDGTNKQFISYSQSWCTVKQSDWNNKLELDTVSRPKLSALKSTSKLIRIMQSTTTSTSYDWAKPWSLFPAQREHSRLELVNEIWLVI